MKTVPDWPRVMRRVLEKDETGTELAHLGDMVLIRRGRGGWEEHCQERLRHISWRERGKEKSDFMLKEGDGCDPVDSHVPPWGLSGAYFPSSFSPLSVRTLLSSALLQHLESV